ncbi:family 78 glycoside hydrolase catalytic domain [Olivibacter sitiensis]|uniref:family 78 glycoside hydrolase catalytic domain n=1 Tax=Olivibacter sitiensis TaxID=376470 RepID=UPI0004847949|nr:family 78 glycoside hydrolase catalytic domain [Olivibacter sitiensis]
MKKVILFSVLSLVWALHVKAADFFPTSLTCEFAENPLGLATSSPRFSWAIAAGRNDVKQSAYELLVSETVDGLQAAETTTWCSGKVHSDQSVLVEWNGKPIKPFQRYYWKVRVFNVEGIASEWSDPAWFETAMLSQKDWKAHWIGDGQQQFEKDEEFYQDDPMPLFRKEFDVKRDIASARLYICGLGYYEASFNGKKVSENILDPGWTAHRKEVLYVTHDVTGMIKKGKNVAGVMLGNGWYNPLPLRLFGRFNLRDHQQTGRPIVKAQLLLTYKDGTTETIVTDESWSTAKGPVIRNNIYLGERYDAQLEVKNWNRAGTDPSLWKPAVIEQGPDGLLVPQLQPPVRIREVVKPVSVWQTEQGSYIVDMGVNFAGVARIKLKGSRGTQVTLRYGEDIYADSTLNWMTSVAGQIKSAWGIKGGPGAPPDAYQEDAYVLKGGATEEYTPHFTFHGFRYVEVFGWPGKLTTENVEGIRLAANLKTNGTFACSNDMFNQLHDVTLRTFLSNVFSVQSDCPAREKMGYGGDMFAVAESYIYNFDMASFYWKTVRDFINDQRPEGGITEIAPFTGIADKGLGDDSGPLGWQLAFPYLQKKVYEFYGDKRIIAHCYPMFVKQMDFIQSKAINGLFHWDIGDHNALDPRAEAFSASAFYYHHAKLIAEFAAILGKDEDAARHETLAANIKRLITRKYLMPGTGRFDNATQAAQLFALYYDFSPEADLTFDVLLKEYERHNWHLSTGIFAAKMGFDVLRKKNMNHIAYRLANQRDFPSWGYMLAEGATSLWESWQYPESSPSQNHPMFGSTEEWFFRSLLGINPAKPGFKEVQIKPQPGGDLTWAKGTYNSPYGLIVSDWAIVGNTYTIAVEIPGNTTATVYVKSKKDGVVRATPGASFVQWEDGFAVYSVASGKYLFETDDSQ